LAGRRDLFGGCGGLPRPAAPTSDLHLPLLRRSLLLSPACCRARHRPAGAPALRTRAWWPSGVGCRFCVSLAGGYRLVCAVLQPSRAYLRHRSLALFESAAIGRGRGCCLELGCATYCTSTRAPRLSFGFAGCCLDLGCPMYGTSTRATGTAEAPFGAYRRQESCLSHTLHLCFSCFGSPRSSSDRDLSLDVLRFVSALLVFLRPLSSPRPWAGGHDVEIQGMSSRWGAARELACTERVVVLLLLSSPLLWPTWRLPTQQVLPRLGVCLAPVFGPRFSGTLAL